MNNMDPTDCTIDLPRFRQHGRANGTSSQTSNNRVAWPSCLFSYERLTSERALPMITRAVGSGLSHLDWGEAFQRGSRYPRPCIELAEGGRGIGDFACVWFPSAWKTPRVVGLEFSRPGPSIGLAVAVPQKFRTATPPRSCQ